MAKDWHSVLELLRADRSDNEPKFKERKIKMR